MKNVRLCSALVTMALLVGACGSTSETTPTQPSATNQTLAPTTDPGSSPDGFIPGEVVRLDLARIAATVTDSDIAAVVAADAAFGMDLFRVAAGETNLMLSPYSIAAALSMLYPGARGATATEIADVLNLSVDDETLHAVRNHIDTALATTPPPMGDEDTRAPFTVRPANSAWGQGGYPFLDQYLQILAENYGAGLRLLDYAGDPEGSRAIVNEWVEDTTEDRIKDLIPEGAITVDTRLALVNAIWFKANWFEPFNKSATTIGPFQLLDGTEVDASLMQANRKMGYASNELFDAVRLPYAGDAAMVVLLPKSGSPAGLAAALGPDDLSIAWDERQVTLTLPSFEFETELGLKSVLQELGMRTAFEGPSGNGADLTGITAVRELYVSDAFHKTFVALDEEGTEAAAATALVITLESAAAPATLTANRPFLFWIEHSSTGEMLFLGQVTNPAETP
ncbi:MAG: serpin family protein [Acidimicrobiia bacterium]|nr:serpin family protein [Acidimicrobiia bacterium]MDX2467600.1 serpin family protein [Acidimicrobiia bacterium]